MSQQEPSYPFEQEFSFKKLFNDRATDVKYILQYKKTLALFLIAGGLIGAAAAFFKRPTYTARLTFVIDDSKSSGMGGGLSALAGQFGFNLDGLGGASGVLAGDNVEQLIKSQKLIKATLQTAYDGTHTLADKYAEVHKLNNKWKKYSPDGNIVRFPLAGGKNTRLQDSLLHEMIILILDDQFGIAKTDKKLGFFEVNTTMKDELLSALFCSRMIKQSTDFFITTKIRRLRNNVNRLQKRADSIEVLLNKKMRALSSEHQNMLDFNPGYTSTTTNVDVKERDKIVLSTIFSETVKNLEASKTMLAQETPTVQVVDEPELPLKKNTLKYYIAIPGGIIASLILCCFYLLLARESLKPEANP